MRNRTTGKVSALAVVKNQVSALAVWVGPVPGAVKGKLAWEEVKRSVITAASSGVVVSIANSVLQGVVTNAPQLFPNNSGLVVAGCTLCIELIRRFNHQDVTQVQGNQNSNNQQGNQNGNNQQGPIGGQTNSGPYNFPPR